MNFGIPVVLMFLLGVCIGCLFTSRTLETESVGTLKIMTDEDGTYLFMELKEPGISSFAGKEYVTIKVDHSHE